MGRLRIVSTESTPFENREAAGGLLGDQLAHLRSRDPVVLGIPRGGLVVAHALSKTLDAELDAIFALKLSLPDEPEFAIGALIEGGDVFLNERIVEDDGIRGIIEEEKKRRQSELSRRADLIRKFLPRVPLAGRTVIIADDGILTGNTARAACRAVGREHPRELIAAIPVGPDGCVERLADAVDELVCLRCPSSFMAVSQFYRQFPQVEDEEIIRLLRP